MYLLKRGEIFYISYIDETTGKEKRISTGKKNKSDALKALAELQLINPDEKPIQSLTLKIFRTEYLEFANHSFSKSYLQRAIKPAFKKLIECTGNILINDLDHKSAEKFILEYFSDSKYGAALYYRTLKSIFNKAIAWNYIQENPFTKFKIPKIPVSYPVYITDCDLQEILKNTKEQKFKNLFFALFHTGMRLGEILNLQWSAIDLKERIITVKNTKAFTTKAKKERVIPINMSLLKILNKMKPKDKALTGTDFVFYNTRGAKLEERFVSKKFKKAAKDAKLNNKIHLHTLRHSFASNLVQRGVSLYVIKELLGHSDLKTTQIYAHLEQNNLIDAVKLLDKKIK